MPAAIRPIDRRFRPPVRGVDLEQSLNYIALADVSPRFVYDHYTGSRLVYERGSRPVLEKIVRRVVGRRADPLRTVQRLAVYVAKEVPWAGFFAQRTGKRLPPDRGLTEEQIIRSGFGWCNEQARVLCCLTQIAGVPSRLVFACNARKRYGHVVCETLLPAGWMMVDESFGYCFLMGRRPVRALDVFHKPRVRAHFEPIYRKLCRDLTAVLGLEIMKGSFDMALAPNPLDGFKDLGYCNHFVR
jgi:transglutaminase-like putative cysteine protease